MVTRSVLSTWRLPSSNTNAAVIALSIGVAIVAASGCTTTGSTAAVALLGSVAVDNDGTMLNEPRLASG